MPWGDDFTPEETVKGPISGARVLLADLNAGEARNASNELNSPGYNTQFIKCGVAKEDDVKRKVSRGGHAGYR